MCDIYTIISEKQWESSISFLVHKANRKQLKLQGIKVGYGENCMWQAAYKAREGEEETDIEGSFQG